MPSRIESGFVPLPKVEQEQPEDRIKIVLNLPGYVDQDRIGVNLTGISKLCDLGGIRQLVVLGKTDEETSHVISEVSGMNSDGSAVASKKMARVTVPTFEASTHDNSSRSNWMAERWISLGINLNVDEIGLHVSEEKGGVHAVENWTRELDKGVRVPIRRAGNQNLLHGLRLGDTMAILNIALAATNIFQMLDVSPLSAALVLAYAEGFKAVEEFFVQRFPDRYPDHRFSLFPGFQLDRAIALGVTSRTRSLIRDLRQETQ
jgi:hypothetical protein